MTNMKNKILFISPGLKKGGAENQLVKLAVFLRQHSFQVTIATFVSGNDFEKTLETHGISYTRFKLKSVGGLLSFFSFVKSLNPDILISFMFGANLMARLLKVRYRIPIITSVRNNEIANAYRRLYKVSYKLDNITTFNSNYALNKFIKERLTVKEKSYLVNNAIEITTESIAKQVNEVFTLVSIAHFRPQKDYKTLFEAIANLKSDGIKIKLYVIGHLFNQAWPLEMIEELKITNEVELVGFTNTPEEYIKKADALVLSSLWEGTPNAILEGMSYQTPIIASNIPGNNDLVEEGKCGYLFKKQDKLELSEKIIQMMNDDEDKRKQFGLNGHKYILENYDSKAVHQKWKSLIESVLK